MNCTASSICTNRVAVLSVVCCLLPVCLLSPVSCRCRLTSLFRVTYDGEQPSIMHLCSGRQLSCDATGTLQVYQSAQLELLHPAAINNDFLAVTHSKLPEKLVFRRQPIADSENVISWLALKLIYRRDELATAVNLEATPVRCRELLTQVAFARVCVCP